MVCAHRTKLRRFVSAPALALLLAIALGSPRLARAVGTIEALVPPTATYSRATSLSADGSKAAGLALSSAFVWEAGAYDLKPIQIPPPESGYTWTDHYAVSAWISDDGETLIVQQFTVDTTGSPALLSGIRYDAAGANVFYREHNNGYPEAFGTATEIEGMSPDGSAAFGWRSEWLILLSDDTIYVWDTTASDTPPLGVGCIVGDPFRVVQPSAASVDVAAGAGRAAGYYYCYMDWYPDESGSFITGPRYVLFTATPGGIVESLTIVPVDPSSYGTTRISAASADGGTVAFSLHDPYRRAESELWTPPSTTTQLVSTLPGMSGATLPHVSHISADGSVLMGTADDGAGTIAFRWEAGQLTWLGDLPGGAYESEITGATPDGNVIVGLSETAAGPTPFYWSSGLGLRSLEDVLSVENGIDLTGLTIHKLVDLSDDGTVLLINATSGSTQMGFRVELAGPPAVPGPAAGTLGLVTLSGTLCWAARRALRG